MPRRQQRRGTKKRMSMSGCVGVGIINIGGGLVMALVYGSMQPATTDTRLAAIAGWVMVASGIGWFYRPLQRTLTVRQRRRRSRHGLCVKCGYNLKGVSHLRCPECGHQNVPYEDFDEYAPLDESYAE